jgi:dipeptidase E
MRLYLSSFELGDCPEKLVSLAGRGARAALILNALDHRPHARGEWLSTESAVLSRLGFQPRELDLRTFFGAPRELAAALESHDLLWINGGNSFLLRRAMRLSGFDSIIGSLLASDRLVYAGFSAGVMCAAPTLRGVELVDDPNVTAVGYTGELVWEGLGLIEKHVAVHYQSRHPESAAVDAMVRYYEEHAMPYITLRDGAALVIDGERTEIVGQP